MYQHSANNARDVFGRVRKPNKKKKEKKPVALLPAPNGWVPIPGCTCPQCVQSNVNNPGGLMNICCPNPQIVRQVMITGDTVDTCTNCGWTSTPSSAQQAASSVGWGSYSIKYSPISSFYDPAGVVAPPPKLNTAKIDQLATVEARMVKPEVRIPDLTECIIGWRGWLVKVVDGQYRLTGVGVEHVWEPKKPLKATCKPRPFSLSAWSFGGENPEKAPHDCPDKNCSCGVWAFRSLDEFKKMGEQYSATAVVGQVYLWGRVLECENGYRAATAYPKELWLFNNEHESLGWIYNVPIRVIE